MNLSNQVKKMLKDNNVTEEDYIKARTESNLDDKMYESLALEYNAPLGITWEEMSKQYQKMYPDINIKEYLDRMQIMLEEGKDWDGNEIKDFQAFAMEVEKNIKQFRKKSQTKPATGISNKLKVKIAKLNKLYLKYKSKGHPQKEVHNKLKAKHFPEWSIETIKTYLKK